MKRTGKLLLGVMVCSLLSLRCEATVYTSDGTDGNVQYLHDNVAQSGDTIRVPAGTFTWSVGVALTKNITLQGVGVAQTIIRDAVQETRLILWDYSALAKGRPRLTGIEFQDGGRTSGGAGPGGIIHFTGPGADNGTRLRFDHCRFNDMAGQIVTADVLGVFDHDDFINSSKSTIPICVYNENWNGGTYSDGSWTDESHFGTDQFLFLEDCTATNLETSVTSLTDGYRGARFVVRHCMLNQKNVQSHGTDTGSYPSRGTRALEVYNNIFNGLLSSGTPMFHRSGSIVVHDNAIIGYYAPQFTLRCYRAFVPFVEQSFGGADGTNVFDVNFGGGPFYTGTAAASTAGTTVTVSGANFTTNRWAGYSIKRTTNIGGLDTAAFSEILSSTSNTITYAASALGYTNLAFTAGDTLKIYRVLHALDQPGRSGGTFVSGNPPAANGPNNQVTEACYSWNNDGVNFAAIDPVIRENEHYFNDTAKPGYVPYIYPHPLTRKSQP